MLLSICPRAAAIVRVEIPASHLGEALGIALAEVSAAIAASGVLPIGGPFSHYLTWGGDMVVAEIGFPVSAPIEPRGRVIRGELPGGAVATVVHAGPYESIGATYDRLDRWIRDQGAEPAGHMWEIYLRGPGSDPDPAAWLTEVCWPIA